MKIFLMILLIGSGLNVLAKTIVLASGVIPQRTPGNLAFGAVEDMVWFVFAFYFWLTMP